MQREMIKPPALRPGDTIGIAAPASPFDEGAFETGLETLRAMGFSVKVPGGIFEKHGYLAGSDAQRAELLMDLFSDDTVQAIFCARGGFGSMKVLPLLDFDVIRSHPKIVVGFSDISVLLAALYLKSGLVTLHGPLVTTLPKGSQTTTIALMDALCSTRPVTLKPSEPVILNPGKAAGPVLGGNLTVLTHLVGTPFEPPFEGHILFLEDRGEALYRIDRTLSQLGLGGRLDGVAGVILGSFEGCGPLNDVYGVIKKAFHRRDIPMLAGFELGHLAENMTLPLGVSADLDTQTGTLQFLESAVRTVEP
jgi:muramoyltetrapeptide carboxypeptidase